MTVFKTYLSALRKKILGILLYVLIFTAITIAQIGGSEESGGASRQVRIAVINHDTGNEQSEGLANFLKESFRTTEIRDDEKAINESLISMYVDYVAVIEKDRIKYYVHNNEAKAYIVNQSIEEYMSVYGLLDKYLEDGADISGKTAEIMNNNLTLGYSDAESSVKKTENMYAYFNYLSYVLMAVIIMAISSGQMTFNKENVKNRISISRMDARKFNINLLLGASTVVAATWLYFTGLMVFAFGAEMLKREETYLFILSNFFYILPTLALAYLVSGVSKNQEMTAALTNIIALTFSFISGVFVPRNLLPSFIQKISVISPMYWSERLYSSVSGGTFYSIESAGYIAILVLMSVAFLMVALLLRKNRAMKEVG